jgi:hypothetical protein
MTGGREHGNGGLSAWALGIEISRSIPLRAGKMIE